MKIPHTFTLSSQVFLKNTSKQLEERKREVARRVRMELINNLDEETREKIKNRELQVYKRLKGMPQYPSDPKLPWSPSSTNK